MGAARSYASVPAGSWSSPCPSGPPAFVFDIDGVLIRGKRVLPEALDALTTPDGRWRYPVVFMTNGGGVCEARKAAQLTEWLRAPVTADQASGGGRTAQGLDPRVVILSHTPMRDLVPELADVPVLVSGRGDVLQVARSYGLRRALHTRELGAAMPAATPFTKYPPAAAEKENARSQPGRTTTNTTVAAAADTGAPASSSSSASTSSSSGAGGGEARGSPASSANGADSSAPGPGPDPVRDLGLGTEYRDAQLIIDVLTGGGVPARSPAAAAVAGSPPVKLYFSNPDLLWANEFPRPRFGQGAFAHMVLSLHSRLTGGGRPHHVTFFGKPNPQPYRLAERLLLAQALRMGLPLPEAPTGAGPASGADSGPTARGPPFSGIYAIGDNPAADVRGANAAGAPWVSVLVRTGVFQGPGPNCDVDAARIAVDDVADAVGAALHHTRSHRWHSMR
ncbi:hypothetical protein GPECTOR_252g631 [Gonium pectorale]|uniref:Uncharacterized protein n=1 Tax=Gonium pectorale TaxID=33097 RepID=A0A150FW87_GONPE|nr:hypothetical protein GPECTOR_252g631 [Gonium pectorale]|eukprot:KXZ41884.1 hypothetical protein GPECTOR_252g631 [Gonium pectorale]